MNSKIKVCIFVLLIIISAVIISLFSENHRGLPFEYDFVCLIFTLIEFSCVSIICKTNEFCSFCNEHSAIRYKKRSFIVKAEIRKRAFYIISLSITHNAVFFILKKTGFKDFMFLIALNFLTSMFLILFQFFIEIRLDSDMGFLVAIVIYITMTLSGIIFYIYCQSYTNMMSKLLEIINKFNMVNHSSLTRIELLNCSKNQSVLGILCVDIITFIILTFGLRKTDIVERG